DNQSDFLELEGRTVSLPHRVPTRYLRTVAVARGFWDGYRAHAGASPKAFHFLGLGTPIMMPLVALCGWGTAEVTYDAMSPILDAVEGTLYTSRPAYLKVRARKVAYKLAGTPRAVWNCPCPF